MLLAASLARHVRRPPYMSATLHAARRDAAQRRRPPEHRGRGSARRILGRYRLVEQIGVGGTAIVFRAVDERTGRPVAVKLLHPHLLPDAASRARLAAEARGVSGLAHPGIVGLLDVEPSEHEPAVVLELVRGEPLAARIGRGAVAEREVAFLGAELAEALYHAHTRGVIHRDVKPSNVLLGSDGHARLVDFGIARLLGDEAARTTQTGTVMGTLQYMAPEQLQGASIGPRTDLYGLGAVLYEALTGRPPHAAASPIELVEEQQSVPALPPATDSGLAAVITACLQPRLEDRPLHAGRVAHALRAWLNGDPAPARALAPAAGEPAHASGSDAPTLAIAIPARRRGLRTARGARAPRRRTLAGVVGAAGGVFVVATALAVVGSRAIPAVAEGSPVPSATVMPAWATQLAARIHGACGSGPTAATLAALGLTAAQARTDAAVASCAPAPTPAPAEPHPRKGHGGGGHGGGDQG